MMDEINVARLSERGFIVYLEASSRTLLTRWQKNPPSFVDQEKIEQALQAYYDQRSPIYQSLAHAVVNVDGKNIESIASAIVGLLEK